MLDVFSIVLAGLCVAALVYSVLDLVFSEERRVARRLKHLTDAERTQAGQLEPLSVPFLDRVVRPVASGTRRGVSRIAPTLYLARLRDRLRVAGNPNALDEDSFLAVKLFTALAVGALSWSAMVVIMNANLGQAVSYGVLAAILGFFIPDLWLRHRATTRQSQIRRALPDMLDMLMISVEAGLGFDASLAKYLQNANGPLAEEFAKMLQEVNAGLSRRDALRNLAARTQVRELNSFVMAMIQADVFGISVSKVLKTQSHELRVKRRQFAQETAQKAPAKMVFPLIICILPATLIVVAGPAWIAIGRGMGLIGN